MIVWVTRISDGDPVNGAEVTVADSEAQQRAQARTDSDGVAGAPTG